MTLSVDYSNHEIWVIDDDRLDIMTVKRAFSQQKVNVPLSIFTSASDALKRIESVSDSGFPDLILLDLNMPGIDGISFLRKIRASKHFGDIPVFILTTSSNPSHREICSDLNVQGFYTKPVDFFELIPLVLNSISGQTETKP